MKCSTEKNTCRFDLKIMKLKILFTAVIFIAGQINFLHAEEIFVNDFGGKVTVVGRLGKPLGTIVTMEGQLVSEPKAAKTGRSTAAFRVNKVDGKPLETGQVVGLTFPISLGTPPVHVNDIVRLSGYESGAFIGTPSAAREQLGKDASPLDWKFESTVYLIKLQSTEWPGPSQVPR
jgi:hypothetical protein